jgi:hypothetical protein
MFLSSFSKTFSIDACMHVSVNKFLYVLRLKRSSGL